MACEIERPEEYGMTGYASEAIRGVYDRVSLSSRQLSGIVGDAAHTYGYHRCRDVLPGDDYSRVLQLDLQGDGQAASALDIKLSPEHMTLATQRLLGAAKRHDPRLGACGSSVEPPTARSPTPMTSLLVTRASASGMTPTCGICT
jgi:hypothetical protein